MTELYQCDVTGKIYEQDDLARFYIGPSSYDWFDVGPDAEIEEIIEYAVKRIDEAAEAAYYHHDHEETND